MKSEASCRFNYSSPIFHWVILIEKPCVTPVASTSTGSKYSAFRDICRHVMPLLFNKLGTKEIAKISGFGPSGIKIISPIGNSSFAVSHNLDTINAKSLMCSDSVIAARERIGLLTDFKLSRNPSRLGLYA